MARRNRTLHGQKRNLKKDLGSNATACATIAHSLNDGDVVELSITADTTLDITDVWDGARAVLAVTAACCAGLTLQVNGTAVDPVSGTSFTTNDVNIIYLDVIDDAGDVHAAHFRTL